MISVKICILPRYLRAVRPPPQDSERNEEDRWGSTVRKSPIGLTNNQWDEEKSPLITVSLYSLQHCKVSVREINWRLL